MPRSLGYVNRKPITNEINADHHMFGDHYAKAFSKGLKKRSKCEIINLNANRLTDAGFLTILEQAPSSLLILDISNNYNLSLKSYTALADYLDQPKTLLQQLMLEGNQTGDKPVCLIANALQYNNNLKFLNISKNNITDIGATAVAKMLVMNNKLNVLFMHWNKVRETGGVKIARAINKSDSLQIWDMSFNNIGTLGQEHSVAKALSKAFQENQSLLHVDLSNCNFDGEDIEIINKGLTDNHTIYGIHLLGNMGKTDTLGYVHKSEEVDYAMATLFTRIKPTLERGACHNSKAIGLHAASN